eukprot:TRINITY_DN25854_c0_g1_i4.p1 TRINITY_DN25854_c0_g1~~TRINITY_DN25854_c0_g1_i4.p1  ORF type:complete len:368 (-),score=54.40 TRINITY_DN25854_c0_g1_i4:170-1273(-)
MFGRLSGPLVWAVSRAGQLFMDDDQKRELEGIAAEAADVGLDFNTLFALNVGYDMMARCTSAIVAQEGAGPIHLRNMDWDAEAFWPLTINVNFCREGSTLYRGTTWVGFVGLQTGMRMGSWSISLNFRQAGPEVGIFKNIFMGLTDAWPISLLIRHTLEGAPDFEAALNQFRNARLMAPCYLTLVGSGATQGVILERSRSCVGRFQSLDPECLDGSERVELSPGICVISNIDACKNNFDFSDGCSDLAWAEDDPLLLTAMARRQTCIALLKKHESCLDEADSFRILGTAPICNDQTVYSCLIRPADNWYSTRVVLKWEEYAASTDSAALAEYQASDAFKATRHLQMPHADRRGADWPNLNSEASAAP